MCAGERKKSLFGLIFLLGAIALYFVLLFFSYNPLSISLYILCYIILGRGVLVESFRSFLRKDFFNENTLMTLATLGAFFLQEYEEAVGVMLFYRIGEFLQERAVENSKKYIQGLFKLEELHTTLLVNGNWEEVDPQRVEVGDTLLVKKGEKVPLDGVITAGSSYFDASSLTGESLPLSLSIGDNLMSGMINKGDAVEIIVSKIFADSSIQKLFALIEKANKKRAPIEKTITKFARIYTPIVFGLAFLITLIPPLLFHASFSLWLERGIIFLVISCPCALVLSTPLGFFSGLGVASQRGILIKSGEQLQFLTKLKNIVLDKTGTITHGDFNIQKLWVLEPSKEKEYLSYMVSLESASSHPIAHALKTAYRKAYGGIPKIPFNITEIPGKGLKTNTQEEEILIGSETLMKEENISLPNDIFSAEDVGTRLYMAINKKPVVGILLADSIKPDSIMAIKKLTKSFQLFILSGDNSLIVKNIADKVKIPNYKAQLMPADKVDELSKIKKSGITMFVGDGVNDAPSLALANIGVAMGNKGADLTIETADIVIAKDSLLKIPELLKIASKTLGITKQNIFLALFVKIVVMNLTLFSLANIWGGIVADVGVTFLTILNCFRIFL